MYFFNKLATRCSYISSKVNSLPFFQCCAVTTSPVSIRFVHTSLGTIPSADKAAINGFEFRFKTISAHLVQPYMLLQMHHLLNQVSTLIDKTAPTRSPHFQLENGSRKQISRAKYNHFLIHTLLNLKLYITVII